MRSLAKVILASVVGLALAGAGITTALAVGGHDQMLAMGQAAGVCAAHCLGASHLPDSTPPARGLIRLVALGLIAVTALALSLVASSLPSRHFAHARPSPNLVKLYAHYLD